MSIKHKPLIEQLESRLLLSSATQLVFTTEPSAAGASVNQNLGTVVVSAEDGSGDVVTNANFKIAFSLSNGPGSLKGTKTETAVDGVATFTNLSIGKTGTYALVAKDGKLAGLSTAFSIADQLSSGQVDQILTNAESVSLPTQTIVIVDRQGNVLAIYGQDPDNAAEVALQPSTDTLDDPDEIAQPASTDSQSTINADATNIIDAESGDSPAKYALINALAEARTAAYFESSQNAFTTRTARFIVSPNFPQGVMNTEAGPLLGVEFSQAAGDDALPPQYQTGLAAGLSGNPGGIPLYIDGQPVGGIGVAGGGNVIAALQSLVPEIAGTPAFESNSKGAFYNGQEEYNFDEAVALAGAKGFMAPAAIRSTNIFVNGLALPFTAEGAATTKALASAEAKDGLLTANPQLADVPRQLLSYDVFGKTDSTPTGGGSSAANTSTPYTATTLKLPDGSDVAVTLTNNNPAAGGSGIDTADAYTPDGSIIPSVDSAGTVTYTQTGNYGIVAGTPAPGATESLSVQQVTLILEQAIQSAEQTRAAIRIPSDVPMQIYVAVTDAEGNILGVAYTSDATNFSFDIAVQKARTAAFFSTDDFAFSSRAIGFLSDTTLPPAIEDGVTGPLSGLQQILGLPQNQGEFLPNVTEDVGGVATVVPNPIANGITIFPGGAPLYIDGQLVGAVGISGDGVDQDDLTAFNATAGFRPPSSIEDDDLNQQQIVSDLEQVIDDKLDPSLGLGEPVPDGDPTFTFPSIQQDIALGFDDPDVPNYDHIPLNAASPSETIISRILARLNAIGTGGIHLPYQKFPRNPGV
jgi:uncharacterized protein GlcG (DUF336 family)